MSSSKRYNRLAASSSSYLTHTAQHFRCNFDRAGSSGRYTFVSSFNFLSVVCKTWGKESPFIHFFVLICRWYAWNSFGKKRKIIRLLRSARPTMEINEISLPYQHILSLSKIWRDTRTWRGYWWRDSIISRPTKSCSQDEIKCLARAVWLVWYAFQISNALSGLRTNLRFKITQYSYEYALG